MVESVATWRLEGQTASLSCGPLHGYIKLNRLGAGFVQPTWDAKDCGAFSVLQLRPPLVESKPTRELLDSYIRGDDLVATFGYHEPITVAPQIYWRARHHASLSTARLEIVVSMRTELLDSQPHSAVDSIAFKSRLFHSTTLNSIDFQPLTADSGKHRCENREAKINLFLFRNSELGLSYAEMVHPSDFEAAEIDYRGEPQGDYRVRSYLFPDRLEKGVIRRGRVCGWFMPSENDLDTAVALARQFIEEPLPLTT